MASWQSLLRRAVTAGGRALLRSLQDSLRNSATRSQRGSRSQTAGNTNTSSHGASGKTAREHTGTHRTSAQVPPGASVRPDGNRTTAYEGPIPQFSYAPHPDGVADPGEVVWTWVPYEEDESVGKDRPVLVVGNAANGQGLLVAQMTSKDHDRDAAQEASVGRYWCDIGSGSWDRSGRPSEVRVDRLLYVAPQDVRREGATLAKARFGEVIQQLRKHL